MPPHLHPRSAATSTLFAGTLVASFVVVAVPHIWPCPRPAKKAYLDSEIIFDDQGRPMRRVRKVKKASQDEKGDMAELAKASSKIQGQKGNTMAEEARIMQQLQAESEALDAENARRPCPVPKPTGVLGRFLGFEEKRNEP